MDGDTIQHTITGELLDDNGAFIANVDGIVTTLEYSHEPDFVSLVSIKFDPVPMLGKPKTTEVITELGKPHEERDPLRKVCSEALWKEANDPGVLETLKEKAAEAWPMRTAARAKEDRGEHAHEMHRHVGM